MKTEEVKEALQAMEKARPKRHYEIQPESPPLQPWDEWLRAIA